MKAAVNITRDGCNENGTRSAERGELQSLHGRKGRINISPRIECGTNACNKIKVWNLFKREVTRGKLFVKRYDELSRKAVVFQVVYFAVYRNTFGFKNKYTFVEINLIGFPEASFLL